MLLIFVLHLLKLVLRHCQLGLRLPEFLNEPLHSLLSVAEQGLADLVNAGFGLVGVLGRVFQRLHYFLQAALE